MHGNMDVRIEKEKRYGYRFKDFYQGDDINDIIQQCKVDEAFILNTWKPGRSDEWISRENKHYAAEGLKLKSITLQADDLKSSAS